MGYIYIWNYNNYYNRQLKREGTFQGYANYVIYSENGNAPELCQPSVLSGGIGPARVRFHRPAGVCESEPERVGPVHPGAPKFVRSGRDRISVASLPGRVLPSSWGCGRVPSLAGHIDVRSQRVCPPSVFVL